MAKILRPVANDSLKSEDGQWDTVEGYIVRPFADLFAADNPRRCIRCGAGGCLGRTDEEAGHTYQGFDRERFLAACGLDREG